MEKRGTHQEGYSNRASILGIHLLPFQHHLPFARSRSLQLDTLRLLWPVRVEKRRQARHLLPKLLNMRVLLINRCSPHMVLDELKWRDGRACRVGQKGVQRRQDAIRQVVR